MTQLRSAAPLAASAVLALALLVTGRASADECSSNADCDKGFECQNVGATDCAVPAPACPPDTACDPVQPEPCQPQVQMACVPAACSTDGDCGAGMVCHEWAQECPTSDCACAKDEPDCSCTSAPCEPETTKLCTPKYVLPCTMAADCGAGFDCVELMNGSCSGSSGTGGGAAPAPGDAARPLPPDGAAGAPAADPIPPECTSEPSGQFACVPQEIGCDTDAECLAGWTCVGDDNDVSSPGCDSGGNCFAAPEPEPEPITKHCAPKYYGGRDLVEDGGTPVSGGDPKGGTGSNGGTPNPEAAPGDADASESSSCQMGHAPASSGALTLLAMLGAVFGLSRRRAQSRA
jgi:MYXO-CTERM domain-containing protein